MAKTCRACGKCWYPSVEDVLHVIMKRLRRGARPLRWYQCPHHQGRFHITKQRKKLS